MRNKTRVLLVGSGLVAVVVTALLVVLVTASLPRRSGQAVITGLSHALEIELDEHAVARVRGASIDDVFGAQGFLHAQERFFQMDLARRSAAGELAALFGSRALPADRRNRVFQFRRRAARLASKLSSGERAHLEAYAAGVNAGLADLGARPPEYLFLRQAPEPWTVEDSLLVVYSLYTMLSNNDAYERAQGVMRATLAPEVYDFLTPSASRFDRPLLSRNSADPTGGYSPATLPGRDIVDLSSGIETELDHGIVAPPLTGAASNQWAIGASRSKSGLAILGNDPHLSLRIPNTFYRIELDWGDGVARGVSIPGVPGMLIGATEAVAWGATVSNVDQSDFVVVEVDDSNPTRYRTPDGYEPFTRSFEAIEVAGVSEPEALEIKTTRWGPVVDEDWAGRPLALRATWLDADGLSLAVLDLVKAQSAQQAVAVLERWSGPSLNWMLADASGAIAWIVSGPIPHRVGLDGSLPAPWTERGVGWSGYRDLPKDFASDGDVLFTANNRTLDITESVEVSRFWMRPLRAYRISQLLAERAQLDELDSLVMQLDTRAEGLEFFRDLLLAAVPEDDPDPLLRAGRAFVAAWSGHADLDQTGFRILQLYYTALLDEVLTPLLQPAREADPRFVYRWPLADEPLRRILEEQPHHLLSPAYEDWDELLRHVLRSVLTDVNEDPQRPDADASWGEVNRLDVAHPLGGLPLIGSWLRLDATPIPGSMMSLRVAAPRYGAVMRMSVSPADHAAGILQMPVGQSGHFLSPNFDDLQSDWLNGVPTPFLAGSTVQRFELIPTTN